MTVEPGKVLAGIDPVLETVKGRLETAVPDELRRLEAAYGRPVPPAEVGEAELWRDPPLYGRSDRARIEPDDYPAVLVLPAPGPSDPAYAEDLIDGAVVWKVPYRLRVWAFCRYFGGPEVARCRNRLALACLQAVFRAPKLADGIAVDLSGWRQSFSDVDVDVEDQSTYSAWWLELTVNQTETVTLDSLARADVITVVVHPEAD